MPSSRPLKGGRLNPFAHFWLCQFLLPLIKLSSAKTEVVKRVFYIVLHCLYWLALLLLIIFLILTKEFNCYFYHFYQVLKINQLALKN